MNLVRAKPGSRMKLLTCLRVSCRPLVGIWVFDSFQFLKLLKHFEMRLKFTDISTKILSVNGKTPLLPSDLQDVQMQLK